MVLTGIDGAAIPLCVMNGTRLPLDVITGPADLMSFATKWIPLCWHQSPDQRPSFDGKHCCCDTHYQSINQSYVFIWSALYVSKSESEMPMDRCQWHGV